MIPARFKRHRVAIAAVIAFALLAGGAAAYWQGTGSGSTQTQLGHPNALILTPGTPSAQLYPGAGANVAILAANPNEYPVHIGSLALNTSAGTGGFDVDAGHSSCSVSSLDFTAQNNGGAGWTLPAAAGGTDGVLQIDLTGALTMAINADNACQNASFTVHLTVGA